MPRVEVNPKYPVVDSIQLHRVGSSSEHGFAGLRQSDLAIAQVVGIAGQRNQRVSKVRAGQLMESGKENHVADQIGVEVKSYDFADNTGSPGPFLLCSLEELGFPTTQTCLVVGIPMNK